MAHSQAPLLPHLKLYIRHRMVALHTQDTEADLEDEESACTTARMAREGIVRVTTKKLSKSPTAAGHLQAGSLGTH